jgi:hypothetical protein
MGSLRCAGSTPLVFKPWLVGSPRNGWPNLLWQRCTWRMYQSQPIHHPSLPSASSSLSPIRAMLRSSDRASESIPWRPLLRAGAGAARALRRWMLPTVERGPPVHISVGRRSRSLARAGSRGKRAHFAARPIGRPYTDGMQ